MLDLPDQEISWLARHLGHSEDVHCQYYRKHDRTIELGKVAKLLIASQTGTLHQYKGKTMSNMEVSGTSDEDWWPAASQEEETESNAPLYDNDEDSDDSDVVWELKSMKRKSKQSKGNAKKGLSLTEVYKMTKRSKYGVTSTAQSLHLKYLDKMIFYNSSKRPTAI